MSAKLVHIGFGNYLSADRIVAIAMPKSAPIKRGIREEREKGMVIDLTDGHKTKSVIFTDAKYMVLVALHPVTVNERLEANVR